MQTPLSGPLSYQKIKYDYMEKGTTKSKTIHYLSDFHIKKGKCKDRSISSLRDSEWAEPTISLIDLVEKSLEKNIKGNIDVDMLIEIGKGYEKIWKPENNNNYLNEWIKALRKFGCLQDLPSQVKKCSKKFPRTKFIECDFRQELFCEYKTMINNWIESIECGPHALEILADTKLHYDMFHKFLYNKASNESEDQKLFLCWIDKIITARKISGKSFSLDTKLSEFMYDLYYELTHDIKSEISELINKNILFTYYDYKLEQHFRQISIDKITEASVVRMLYTEMLEKCKKSWIDSPSFEHIIIYTSWLLDLYTIINIFASNAQHIILVTGYKHTELIQSIIEETAKFKIYKSPLFQNDFQQCISFPHREKNPTFDFSGDLFLDIVHSELRATKGRDINPQKLEVVKV